MKNKIPNISLQHIEVIFIIALIFWISFFPYSIQETYHILTNIFLILVFLVILIGRGTAIFKKEDNPLWFFLIAIGINVLFAQQKSIALKTYLNLAIPMFTIYYILSRVLLEENRFIFLAKTICLSSIIVSSFAILESLFAFNPLYEYFVDNPYYQRYITGFSRPMSTQFAAPALGSYLVGCLPFSLLLFKKERSLFKILGSIGIIFNTVVIILTFSRGAFLGLLAMITFYLFAIRQYLLIFIFFIIVFISVCTFSLLPYPFYRFGINGLVKDNLLPNRALEKVELAPSIIKDRPNLGPEYYNRFRIEWILKDSLLSAYRQDRLDMTLRIIKDHPFVGVGFQHFRIRFYDYYPYKYKFPYEIMVADNMYLTLLSETGIIGFLGFFVYIFSLVKNGWGKLKILNYSTDIAWILLISLMAFIGLLVNMAGYEFFYWPNQYIFFCIIAGCISACLRFGGKQNIERF
jgi:hypothetical protein